MSKYITLSFGTTNTSESVLTHCTLKKFDVGTDKEIYEQTADYRCHSILVSSRVIQIRKYLADRLLTQLRHETSAQLLFSEHDAIHELFSAEHLASVLRVIENVTKLVSLSVHVNRDNTIALDVTISQKQDPTKVNFTATTETQ